MFCPMYFQCDLCGLFSVVPCVFVLLLHELPWYLCHYLDSLFFLILSAVKFHRYLFSGELSSAKWSCLTREVPLPTAAFSQCLPDLWLQRLDQTFRGLTLWCNWCSKGVPLWVRPRLGFTWNQILAQLSPRFLFCLASSLVRILWKILSQQIIRTWILVSGSAFIEPGLKSLTFSRHIFKMQIHGKLRH